jgi:hypothetical protein
MAEFDAFERRVADTLAWYADDVSPAVDAAAVAHRVALEHPRDRASALAWRAPAVPRAAGALLLLAGLLAALVGGMLVVGSQPVRKVPAVVPAVGPAFACPPGSTPDKPGPIGQARPPLVYAAQMAFDRRAGQIVLLAEGNVDDARSPETWTFDVCTNTWTKRHPDRVPPGLNQLVYDADSDVTITVDSGTRMVWSYDLQADTWTAMRLGPIALPGAAQRLVYDAASGLVVEGSAGIDPNFWTYDVGTDLWTPIGVGHLEHHGLLAYDASVDRLFSYTEQGGVHLLDIRRGAWSTGTTAPEMWFGWGPSGNEIAYDEAAKRTVVFSYGRMIAYDAAADRWEIILEGFVPGADLCDGPRCTWLPTMVYDPVNERLVVYGGSHPTADGWAQGDDVLAFDLATREWTVLLEASHAQPSP